ncbi:hypothetical protein M011DRAFT_527847 [Sporormia fimetaria CBS 119925]|uniref:MYND-type domain-containing protein n=1 Tax=Sporormia fimetaria CBS 119925 TaxID=1340428 RepID=A0A6A6V7A5_9PLEO|nr:hypothetical protein M011DRAFT_527847 [Sporormia fimetaria CBS 119925]
MPARSVLLNVSITAKSINQKNVISSVREIHPSAEKHADITEEAKRERVDSATAEIITTHLANISYTTKSCNTCHQSNKPDGSALAYCKACTSVYYCSKECQRVDWPGHKRHCSYRLAYGDSSAPNSVPASPTH